MVVAARRLAVAVHVNLEPEFLGKQAREALTQRVRFEALRSGTAASTRTSNAANESTIGWRYSPGGIICVLMTEYRFTPYAMAYEVMDARVANGDAARIRLDAKTVAQVLRVAGFMLDGRVTQRNRIRNQPFAALLPVVGIAPASIGTEIANCDPHADSNAALKKSRAGLDVVDGRALRRIIPRTGRANVRTPSRQRIQLREGGDCSPSAATSGERQRQSPKSRTFARAIRRARVISIESHENPVGRRIREGE